MDNLISTVNQLQALLVKSGLQPFEFNLPQIIVVGSQSAGKSSVLENFVAREFLPRGSGVVTKTPIIIHLMPDEEELIQVEGNYFSNFEEAKQSIQNITESRIQSEYGFSKQPITVKIFSPNVLTLTLVDLPGLVKVRMPDQPVDIVNTLRNMVLEYITASNAIILAVSPANQDIANSDALNIAEVVDPNGERTINILTKLDIMDKGTSARDILDNKILKLKLGHIGVVNRSQEDIDKKEDLKLSLQKEKEYFSCHPDYCDIAERLGTKYLQKYLSQCLHKHIKEKLPELHQILRIKLDAVTAKLEELSPDLDDELDDRIVRYVDNFHNSMLADIEGQTDSVKTDELCAGAKIMDYLYSKFKNSLLIKKPSSNEVHTVVANTCAIRKSVFTPSLAFDNMCKTRFKSFEKPISDAINMVTDMLLTLTRKCSDQFKLYSHFQGKLNSEIEKIIQQQANITKKHLQNYIKAESNLCTLDLLLQKKAAFFEEADTASANNCTPEYIYHCLGSPVNLYKSENNNSSEVCSQLDEMTKTPAFTEKNMTLLQKMVLGYMNLIKTKVVDSVIKYIYYFLIKETLNCMKHKLILEFLSVSNKEKLLEASEEFTNNLENMKILQKLYQDSIWCINEL